MRCSEFLTSYSDLRDRDANSSTLRQLVEHMSLCRRCARYHNVIESGVSRLRSAASVEPSAGFQSTLQRRISASITDVTPLFPVPVRFVGSLVVAAAVATSVIQGVTRSHRDSHTPPERPMPMVRANPSPPFVTFADLSAPVSFGRPVSFELGYATYSPQRHVTFSDTVAPD